MPNYVFAYTAGGVPETEAERKKVTDSWYAWIGAVGADLIDVGTPFGASKAMDSSGRLSDGGAANLSGYSIVRADSFADAEKLAAGCPQLVTGGAIDIYETIPVEM